MNNKLQLKTIPLIIFNVLLFVVILVYGILISPISTEYTGTYKVISTSGNESLYDVTFETVQVETGSYMELYDEEGVPLKTPINVTTYRTDTIICAEAQWNEKEVIEYTLDEKEEKEVIDKNYTYPVPETLSMYKEKPVYLGLIQINNPTKDRDLTRVLEKDNALSLTPDNYEVNDTYKFCYQANPEEDFYLKLGDNSIIIIQTQDVTGTSLLTNVTAEGNNFTHLNISTTAPYDSLVGYWNFDGDKENTLLTTHYDWSKEGNDGTGAGNAVVNSTGGLYDDGLVLDGATDFIDISGPSFAVNSSSTKIFWINSKNWVAYNVLLSYDNTLYEYLDASGDPGVRYYNIGHTLQTETCGACSLNTNQWYHVGIVFDVNASNDINISYYVDGDFKESDVNTGGSEAQVTEMIGARYSAGGNGFNGTIDDVMIFNTSLTQEQITAIYNNQSARFVNEGTQKVRAVSITNTTTWNNLGNNRVNLTTSFERNLGSNISARIGQMNLSVDPDGLVAYYPFEWGSAVDISGGGNDGTILEGVTFNETGGQNDTGGFEFDGDDDWINFDGTLSIDEDEFTLIAWFITEDTDHNRILRFNAGDDAELTMYTHKDGALTIYNGSGICDAGSNLDDGNWHMGVVVKNSTNDAQLYVDGVAGTPCADYFDFTFNNFSDIGGWQWDGWDFNGTIDEVMLWNRSLSQTEITNLFNNQSLKHNTAYYTDYQNLTGSGENTTFTINKEADFIFPDFKFLSGTNKFYSPILNGSITLETWNFTGAGAPADTEYPIFSNFIDNNATLIDTGTGLFNVTIINTNGTVFLEINNTNLTATNLSLTLYNVSYDFTSSGNYSYRWLSWGNGTDTNFNESASFGYTVNASVDTEYPIFTLPTETPSEPTTYLFGQDYQFNITINFTNGTVGLEFNGTNYTTSNLTKDVYNYTFPDLSAGNYNYYWWGYGNGTDTLFNNSVTYSYNISKAIPEGNLTNTTLWTITYPTEVTIGLKEDNNGDGDLTYIVYRDGTSFGTGETITLGVGTYDYVLNTTGGTNWTTNISMDAETLTVNQNTTYVLTLTGTSPITYGTAGDFEGSDCPAELVCNLTRNDTGIVSNPDITTLAAGSYNYTFNTSGNANYSAMNISDVLIVNQAIPEGILTNQTNLTLTYPQPFNFTFSESQTGDGDVSYLVYRDGTNVTNENGTNVILGVGTYDYVFNTSGGVNWTSNSSFDSFTVTVTQNTTYVLSVALTPSDTETYPTETTATGSGCPAQIVCNLTLNSTGIVVNPHVITLGVAVYNYTFNSSGNTNYSSMEVSDILTINQNTSAVVYTYLNNSRSNITIFNNTAIDLNATLFNVTGTISLYNNGTLINTNLTTVSNLTAFNSTGLFNITAIYEGNTNYSRGFETWWVNVTAVPDIEPPYFLHVITNQTINNESTLSYDINATDETSFGSFAINWTNNFTIDGTTGVLTNDSMLVVGIYWINVTINDTSNNLNSSVFFVNVTETLDTDSPYFLHAITNQSIYSNESLSYDINATDYRSPVNYTINWTNNFTIDGFSGLLTNDSTLAIGIYWINITINDTSNNLNSTVFFVNVSTAPVGDSSSPLISIVYPTNNSYSNNTGLNINYTVSDTNLDSCWYSNDTYNGNITLANCVNITTITWNEGNHNVTIWANDSTNNLNYSVITFTIDTTTPNATHNTPADSSESSTTQHNMTGNFTDETGIENITIFIYNTTGLYNQTTLDLPEGTISKIWGVIVNFADGVYKWFWRTVDKAGNILETGNRTITIDSTPPTFDNLQNHSQSVNQSFSFDLDASDNLIGVESYQLNDTSFFNISSVGLIINITNLSRVETHWLTVTVNDSLQNSIEGTFYINITSAVTTIKILHLWRNKSSGDNVSWFDVEGNLFILGSLKQKSDDGTLWNCNVNNTGSFNCLED